MNSCYQTPSEPLVQTKKMRNHSSRICGARLQQVRSEPSERCSGEDGAGSGHPPRAVPARATRSAAAVPVRTSRGCPRADAGGGARPHPAEERAAGAASSRPSATSSRAAAAPPASASSSSSSPPAAPAAAAGGALEVSSDAEQRQGQRPEHLRPASHYRRRRCGLLRRPARRSEEVWTESSSGWGKRRGRARRVFFACYGRAGKEPRLRGAQRVSLGRFGTGGGGRWGSPPLRELWWAAAVLLVVVLGSRRLGGSTSCQVRFVFSFFSRNGYAITRTARIGWTSACNCTFLYS